MATIRMAAAQVFMPNITPVAAAEGPNPLFKAIVGSRASTRKAACLIAANIEEELIASGWPTGTIYGSESYLADHFGVCCIVVREAVRILESRGTARMKRGPKGGLVVLKPEMPAVLEAIHRYLISHRGNDLQGSVCLQVLRAARKRLTPGAGGKSSSSSLSDFLNSLIDAVEHYDREGAQGRVKIGAAARLAHSRAEQVFRLLIDDLEKCPSADRRLGSELDLCDRYGADRSALRQAVRTLEFEGIAVSNAGRGKGLMSRIPDPTSLCQLINCYFAATGVTTSDAMDLFKNISLEVIAVSTELASYSDRKRLRESKEFLINSDGIVDPYFVDVIEESQFRMVSEPLLDILLRCTKSYASWWSSVHQPDDNTFGTTYCTETLSVISAMLIGNAQGAADAQAAKVDQLASLICKRGLEAPVRRAQRSAVARRLSSSKV